MPKIAEKKPLKDWPDLSFKLVAENMDLVGPMAVAASIRLHAEVVEESLDKISRALWALVAQNKKGVV
jgi:hypothetical protein